MDIFNIEPMKDLLKKVNSNSELEIIFNKSNPLTINKFIDMLKYLTMLSKNNNYKLVKESTLDVGYTNFVNKDIVNYRITISNIDNINKIINNVKLPERIEWTDNLDNLLKECVKHYRSPKGKQLIPWKVIQKEIEEFNTYSHEALRARFRDFKLS